MSQSEDKQMAPHIEGYLMTLCEKVSILIDRKFRKGQEEHGGDIDRQACFPHLRDELTDSLVYFHEHENRLIKWADLLERGLKGECSKEYAMDEVLKQLRLELGEPSTLKVFND